MRTYLALNCYAMRTSHVLNKVSRHEDILYLSKYNVRNVLN